MFSPLRPTQLVLLNLTFTLALQFKGLHRI